MKYLSYVARLMSRKALDLLQGSVIKTSTKNGPDRHFFKDLAAY